MIAVVDTNVLASVMISARATPGRIVDLVRSGQLTLAVDDRILDEYDDVLRRDYLRRYFSAAEAESILDFVQHASHRVACSVVAADLPDPGDVPFLETALTVSAPLVTGNKRHFPAKKSRGAEVLTPAEFLRRCLEAS
jgi:putative PIN family toxin of toxin-antitoxin system